MNNVRVIGDIEGNADIEHIVESELDQRPLGMIPTVFVGDIVSPRYGRVDNIKFVRQLLDDAIYDDHVRYHSIYDISNPLASYKALLTTLKPVPNIKLTDYAEWHRCGNFRSNWLFSTPLIHSEFKKPCRTIFILGNKEVQLAFDIYNDLLKRRVKLDDDDLRMIYDYINHCMDYCMIGSTLYIHNRLNAKYVEEIFSRIISGHEGCTDDGYQNLIPYTVVDATREKNPNKVVFIV